MLGGTPTKALVTVLTTWISAELSTDRGARLARLLRVQAHPAGRAIRSLQRVMGPGPVR